MWFQCLITILRQFFKSICTTKQSDGKCICCALITDYYNPMNKHLSCQHLQYELLPPDCDPICISPHAIFHVKKSLSCVLLIKCEKSASRGVPSTTRYDRGRRNLTATSRVYEVNPAEDHVCISSPPHPRSFSLHICPVILHFTVLSPGKNAKNWTYDMTHSFVNG